MPPRTRTLRHVPSLARFPQQRWSDAELVSAVAQGDNEAVAAVWDRYSGLVRGVLRSSLGMDADVEDLLQEVFIAFLRGAQRIRAIESLRGYLIGVAVRMIMGELRRRRVRRWVKFLPGDEMSEFPAAPVDGESTEVLRALYRMLDRLSERRRLAFVLRYVQGLEVVEAAAVMQVSDSTIKRDARRARQLIFRNAEKSEPLLWEYLQRAEGFAHD